MIHCTANILRKVAGCLLRRPRFVAAAAICWGLLLVSEVGARVGGGGSFGGGHGGGGGGSHGGGGGSSFGGHSGGTGGGGGDGCLVARPFSFLFWLTINHPVIGIPVDLVIIGFVVWWFKRATKRKLGFTAGSGQAGAMSGSAFNVEQAWSHLRRFDPNFSGIIFTDFCYALYGRAQHERAGDLDLLSPYLSDDARRALRKRNPPDLLEVAGIIVGSMRVIEVRGLETPTIGISVFFETNYTEITKSNRDQGGMTYYLGERWEFERRRDVLSPAPEAAASLHCPKCGAALTKDANGACAFCGAKIESGDFQWFVRQISLQTQEARGPLLTSTVQEEGTDLPTVVQANFAVVCQQFGAANPNFRWDEFNNRAKLIFNELQSAWSTLDWERARPHETDSIFQMHQYWIEAYKRQHLRNALDNCRITGFEPCKIAQDAFYDAITVRIAAEGNDYTVDENTGRVVTGSRSDLRRWTEYWTFVRYRDATATHVGAGLNCPNCGAPLRISAAGICEYCHSKITSGEFDWVLSKIEQDESYQS